MFELYNYFNPTKLLLHLYLTKFVDTSTKLYFPYTYSIYNRVILPSNNVIIFIRWKFTLNKPAIKLIIIRKVYEYIQEIF